MVQLTADRVERKCSKILSNKSLSRNVKKDQLWKLTHLRMNDMFISSIGNISACKNLKVIYLQNNNISKLENLQFALYLTHLYLQHNEISKIENLEALENLQKLYLSYNRISVVEGLENLKSLTELHIENQTLASGESLCFDPRTANGLSSCLKTLNISNNRMTSLKDINCFYKLEILEAKDNMLNDINDLTETIKNLISLRDLYLKGNPVTHHYRYRENLIANSNTLVNLDNKTVSEVNRKFMMNFKMEKHLQETKKKSNGTLSDDITSSLNLPPSFKKSISRAIFQQHCPKLSVTVISATGESQPQIFPPWKSVLKTLRTDNVMTKPLWKNSSNGKKLSLVQPTVSKRIALPPI